MSMLSSQCDNLRKMANELRRVRFDGEWISNVETLYLSMGAMREAASTIEALSDKLKDGKGAGIKTCHIEGYDDGIDENCDGDLYSYGPPTWFLSCGHQGEGIDAPDFCPVCGAAVVDSETNWEKLFGTPERTAETLKRMDVDVFNWCVDDSSNHENCRACPYEYDYYGCYLPDGFSMLEWLKGASDEV